MVIIVGADRLGNIEDVLQQRGYSELMHVRGRNPKAQSRWEGGLERAQLMVLFTDFLGHNVMRKFRRLAKDNRIPYVACRRSTVSLSEALDRLAVPTDACAGCQGCERRGVDEA
jgi:hypothetical protein